MTFVNEHLMIGKKLRSNPRTGEMSEPRQQLLNKEMQVNVGISVFLVFWPTSIAGEGGIKREVKGMEKHLGGISEVSPEEREVADWVEKYPESDPQDAGPRTVPNVPGDPLLPPILLRESPSRNQSQSPQCETTSVHEAEKESMY